MQKPLISIIVAMAKNRTIGINNTLPWRIPADLQHFKRLTTGHHIIMGRKTFDSIGKPLPNRTSVVVTRNEALTIPNCIMSLSLENALQKCAQQEEIFIVGGAEIYAQALPFAQRIYLTEVQQDVEGDAFFPELDLTIWQETQRDIQQQDIPTPLEFHFVTYQRR